MVYGQELVQGLFEEIKGHLEEQMRLREGTIVDATIIESPSSTKNRSGQRDPEMPGEEGEPAALRDETAHRSGRQDGLGASFSTTSAHDVT